MINQPTNNEWIEKAYKAYKENIPNYINPIDSFKKAIQDNLPPQIYVEAISKKETPEQQSDVVEKLDFGKENMTGFEIVIEKLDEVIDRLNKHLLSK